MFECTDIHFLQKQALLANKLSINYLEDTYKQAPLAIKLPINYLGDTYKQAPLAIKLPINYLGDTYHQFCITNLACNLSRI